MANEQQGGKIGEGHAHAMLRQGLREVRGALYNDSNVAQQPELGLYGTMTPGEIAESRRQSVAPAFEEEKDASPLQQSMRQAETRSQNRDDRDRGLER